MKTGHPKTLTLDQNALRKVLDDMKPDLDDERVLRRLTLNRNNSNMNQKNFARTDHSPMTDRTHYRDENKPIMRDARFDHEYDAYNQNYPVKDLSSSLYAENEQLKKENKTLKLKEQKYLSQISSLEREKKSLVALLEQSEQNLQDSIKKSKQESKRMNAVIESFRRSLQCAQQQNSKEDKAIQAESPKKKYYVKDNFSFQATASPQRQTEQNNYSMVVIEQLADLSMKVKTLECHAQELVKENGRLINEVESLKAYNSRLEQYIQTNRPVLEGLLEEKRVRGSSSNVEAENALYKLFVRDLATNDSVRTLEEQSAFTNSAGYSGGKYAKVPRHSSAKQFGKPDPACEGALQAINQNPKFARLLVFSINTLTTLVHPPNTKHRDNAHYVFTEKGHLPLIAALKNHITSDTVLHAATKCLLGIVGEGKHTDEDKAKKLVEDGVVEALVAAFNHESEKSTSTQKLMISLLGILAVNPSNCAIIAEQGGVELCMNVAQQEKAKPSVVKQAMLTLERISSNPAGRAIMIKTGGIKHLIDLFNKKADDPIVIQGGLRTLGNLSKSKEAISTMKENEDAMNTVVKLLEKNPEEKQIVNLASNMLSKISTINDLDKAIASVRAGNTAQISILSSLVLVDEMMEAAVKKGIIADLIAILEKTVQKGSPDDYEVIRNCTIALGRIAEMGSKHAQDIVNQGGIDLISHACDIQDPDVLRACSDTLQKLCVSEANIKSAVSKGCVSKLLKSSEAFPKDEKLAESICSLISQIGAEHSAREEIFNGGAAANIVSRMRAFFENRKIQEQGFKALDLISSHKQGARQVVDAGAVDHMKALTKKHPEWKKAGLTAVGMVQQLTKSDYALPHLRKANAMEAVVDILSGKAPAEKEKVAVKTEAEEGEQEPKDADIADEGVDESEQTLTTKQEQDLRDSSVEILAKIADESEIKGIKATMSEMGKSISKKSDSAQIMSLETKLNTAACLSLIPGLGEEILKEDVHNQAADLAKKVQSLSDCEAKTPILASLIKFYDNLSDLNNKEASKNLYGSKAIGKDTLEFYLSVLENNEGPIPVALTLRSIGKNLAMKGNVVEYVKSGKFLGVDKIAEKPVMEVLLEATIKNMNKYGDNEEVQIRALEIIDRASQISPATANLVLKLDGSRHILSRIEGGNIPSKKTGVLSLQVLNKLCASKEALHHLANQRGQQAVMSYVARNRNDKEIQDAAAPLLEKLSKVQTEDAAQNVEKDIKSLITELKNSSEISIEKDLEVLADGLEGLGDLAIIDLNIPPMINEDAHNVLLKIIVQEARFGDEDLAEKGVLVSHDRALNSSLAIMKKILANPVTKTSQVPQSLVQDGLIEALLETLKNRSSSEEITVAALSTLHELLQNSAINTETVQRGLNGDVAPILISLMERHKDHPDISGNINRCLITMSQISPEIASKIGQKAFIKNIIKDTRSLLKGTENEDENNAVTLQNLEALSTLAKLPQNIGRLIEEGAVDTAVNVLKKHNAVVKSNLSSEGYSPAFEANLKHTPKSRVVGTTQVTTEDLAGSSVRILEVLLSDPSTLEANLNQENLVEIVGILETANDAEIAHGVLRVLAQASNNAKIAEILSQNEATDKVMGAMNRFPTNAAIRKEASIVLQNLGAVARVEKALEEITQIAEGVDLNAQESVQAFQRANLSLANLMVTKRPEEKENYTALVSSIEKSMAKTVAAPKVMASQLLVVSRLAQRAEEETLDSIRDSEIPEVLIQKLIVENADYISAESGQLADIVFETVKNIATVRHFGKKELDSESGSECAGEKNRSDKLSKQLLTDNGKALDKMLKVFDINASETTQTYNPETVDKAIDALTEVASAYDSVAQSLVDKGSVDVIADYLQAAQSKAEESYDILNDPVALRALANSAKFFSALGKFSDGFEKVKKRNVLPQFYSVLKRIEPKESWGSNLTDPKEIAQKEAAEAIIDLTKALSETSHDKSHMLDAEAPNALLGFVKAANAISPEIVAANPELLRLVDKSMQCLKNLARDSDSARVIVKANGHEEIANILQSLSEARGNKEKHVDPSELQNITKVVGSSEPIEQAIESALMALEELSKDQEYAREMGLLNEESKTYRNLLKLAGEESQNPLICVAVLKIAQNSLQAIPKEKILEEKERLGQIKSCVETIKELYPKIKIVQDLSKRIHHLIENKEEITSDHVEEDVVEQAQEVAEKLAEVIAVEKLEIREETQEQQDANEKIAEEEKTEIKEETQIQEQPHDVPQEDNGKTIESTQEEIPIQEQQHDLGEKVAGIIVAEKLVTHKEDEAEEVPIQEQKDTTETTAEITAEEKQETVEEAKVQEHHDVAKKVAGIIAVEKLATHKKDEAEEAPIQEPKDATETTAEITAEEKQETVEEAKVQEHHHGKGGKVVAGVVAVEKVVAHKKEDEAPKQEEQNKVIEKVAEIIKGEKSETTETSIQEPQKQFENAEPKELADALEEVKNKLLNEGEEAKTAEIETAVAIVEAIDRLAESDEGADKILQYGMIDNTAEVLTAKSSNAALKAGCVALIKKLSDNPKLQEKVVRNPKIMEAVLQNISETAQTHKLSEGSTAETSAIEQSTKTAVLNSFEIIESVSKTGNTQFKEESIKKCLGTLKEFDRDKDISSKAKRTLASLIHAEEDVENFYTYHGVDTVVEAMETNPNDLEMLITLAELVGKTATNEKMQTEYGTKGVVTVLTRGNIKYPQSLQLCSATCVAFVNLVQNHQRNAQRVLESEFVPHAKNFCEVELTNPIFIINAATLFFNLSLKNEENKKILAKVGIVELLIKMFNHYQKINEKRVIKQALKALGNLALLQDNVATIIKNEFIPSISQYIYKRIQEADVVKLCLAVLGNIAAEDVSGSIDKMIEQGTTEVIVACIKEHELNTELLLEAVESLGNLIKSPTHSQQIAEKGGLEAVLRVTKSQDFATPLMKRCAILLADFVYSNENHERFIALGGHERAIQLILSQKASEEIPFECLQILSRLASDKTKSKFIYTAGFVEKAYLANAESHFKPKTINELLVVTAKISQVEEASTHICEKALPQITTTIRKFINDTQIAANGTILLLNLLASKNNVDAVVRDKGIDCLNDVIVHHYAAQDTVINAFKGLSVIALHNEEHRQLCLKSNSDKVVKEAYENPSNAGNEQIITEGTATYKHLTTPHATAPIDLNLSKAPEEKLVTKEIRNFLIAGKIVKLYKTNGSAKEMHLFMTNDLREIVCKRPNKSEIRPEWRVKVHQIKSLTVGYDAKSPFAKHTGLFKKKPDPKLCFSVIGPLGADGQQALYISTTTEAECNKWYDYLTKVVHDSKKDYNKEMPPMKKKVKNQIKENEGTNRIKAFSLLNSMLKKDPRAVIPNDEIDALDLESKAKIIEQISQFIISNPETNLHHIQTLQHLCEDNSVIILKMACMSMTEVFKDIAPLYDINETMVKHDLQTQLSKDISLYQLISSVQDRKLYNFEYNLLQHYKKFVGNLLYLIKIRDKDMLKGVPKDKLTQEQKTSFQKIAADFNYIGLLCLCELMKKLHYFNLRKEIATIIVRKKASRIPQIRDIADQTLREFLKDPNPAFFEIKTIIITGIAKLCTKYPEKKLPDGFYDCIIEMDLTINIVNTYQSKKDDNEVDQEELKKAKKKKQKEVEKEIERVTKKGKKKLTFDKLRKDVLEELKEAEATVDANKLKKQKDEIVKKIFYIFFKILRNQRPSKFFDLAMKGILKYVHMINHTIIQDLLDCLREAGEILREYHLKNMNKKELIYSRLACIFTAIEINSVLGGKQIEFDEKQSVELFYLLWLDIYNQKKIREALEQKDSTLIIKLLEKLFISKRQLSNNIVASFIKMICLVLSKGYITERKFVLSLLFFLKKAFTKYVVCTRMMDEDNEVFGLDMYNEKIEEPQATNAIRACVLNDFKEIEKKHPNDADVKMFVKKIMNSEKLITNIASFTLLEYHKHLINQEKARLSKKKAQEEQVQMVEE